MSNSDHEIIQRIIAGDKRAYSELMIRHKDKAMTLAIRILKNHHDAEEALQDAFVRAFNGLQGFEWKSNFSTWFYRIVYNVCVTKLSQQKNKYFLSIDDNNDDTTPLEIVAIDSGPTDIFESKEFISIVHSEIEKIPAQYGSIFTLFVIQEMSYEEIVSVTGLPLGTVKNRLFRARVLLRNAVVKKFSEKKTVFVDM